MIRPQGLRGVAFATAGDGDWRASPQDRARAADELGIAADWAFVRQVHGATVMEASGPGVIGEGDAIFTRIAGLPVGVATADCVPVAVEGPRVAAVIHAGWRGLAAGVIETTLHRLAGAALEVERAAIGPGIGPCCYEVGEEVVARLSDFAATTAWGSASVDLGAAAEAALGGLTVWRSDRCTRHDEGFFSHRRDRTKRRQVAVAWLPTG